LKQVCKCSKVLLLRPLYNKTGTLLRPLYNKTGTLLRPLYNKTGTLLRPPIFRPKQPIQLFMALAYTTHIRKHRCQRA